jgi:hypothetical protein
MLGADGAVWLATQAIGNDALRPSPAGQMSKLFADEPLESMSPRRSSLLDCVNRGQFECCNGTTTRALMTQIVSTGVFFLYLR